MKGANQKLKLLYLKKFFEEHTDSDHGLTMGELIDLLAREDITAGNQGIYDDINCLRTFGMDIDYDYSNRTYRLINKRYSVPAITTMQHAVQSSTALNEESTAIVRQQLDLEMSKHELQTAKRIRILIPNVVKPTDNSVIDKLLLIQQAIDLKRGMEFRFEWLDRAGNTLSERHGMKTAFPYNLFFARNEYYFLCYCTINEWPEDDKYAIRCVSIKDMHDIKLYNYSYHSNRLPSINITQYINNPFVYGGGKLQAITLEYEKSIEPELIHQFGIIDNPKAVDRTHAQATFPVVVNDLFFGWLFSLDGKAWIVAPVAVKRQFTKKLRTAKGPYRQKAKT